MDLVSSDRLFNNLSGAAFLYRELDLSPRVAPHLLAALVNGEFADVLPVYLHYDVPGFYFELYGRGVFVGLHYHHSQGILADCSANAAVRGCCHQLNGLLVLLRNIFRIGVYGFQHGINPVVDQLGKIYGVHIFGSQSLQDVVLNLKPLQKLEVAALGHGARRAEKQQSQSQCQCRNYSSSHSSGTKPACIHSQASPSGNKPACIHSQASLSGTKSDSIRPSGNLP